MPLQFHDLVTVEHPNHAEGHADTEGDTSHRGNSSGEAGASADPFGAHDSAADFAPEGGPSVTFREYRAPDANPGTEPETGPQATPHGPASADPGAAYAYNPDGTPRYNKDGTRQKKRGRQAGSSQGSRKAPPLRVSGIESILLSTHGMLAALTQFEDFALEEKEAKDLAAGIAAVAEHYPLLQMSDKDRAWLALAGIAASIYGPRAFLAFKLAQKRRAEAARKPGPTVVVPDAPLPGSPFTAPVARPPAAGGFPAFVPDGS